MGISGPENARNITACELENGPVEIVDLAIRNGGWNQVSPHQLNLVGGLEHEIYFSIYWECHNPN